MAFTAISSIGTSFFRQEQYCVRVNLNFENDFVYIITDKYIFANCLARICDQQPRHPLRKIMFLFEVLKDLKTFRLANLI